MSARAPIVALFKLQAGEDRTVGLLFAYSFCIGVARIFTLSAGYALFLDSFDANSLPLVYLAVTVCVSLAGALFFQLQARLGFARLLVVTLGGLLVGLLAFWVGLALPGGEQLAIGVPIFYDVLWALSNLVFGAIAGRLFTLRQGRRLFALVETGESLAIMLGGLLTPVIGALVGALNLLLIAASGLVGALLLLVALVRLAPGELPADDEAPSEPPVRSDLGGLLRQRYVLLVLLVNGLNAVCYYLLDSIFYHEAGRQFADAAALAGFLGVFYAASEVFSLLSRTLVSGKLLARYGVTGGLLAQPVLVCGAALVVITSGFGSAVALIFPLVVLAKLIDTVAGEDLTKASALILYQPLPPTARLRVQTLVDGGVSPLATGLAGLLLITVAALGELATTQRFVLLLPLLAVWTLAAVVVSREYPRVLLRALSRRWLGRSAAVPVDAASLAVFREALSSPRPGVAIFALDSLEERGDAALAEMLPGLLVHPAPEVRQEVLRRIERLRPPEARFAVEALLEREPDPGVRGAALQSLLVLGEGEAVVRVLPFLDHPDAATRGGAMVGLLRSGDLEGVLAAGECLLRLCDSALPAERALAAQTLAAIGARSFYRPLLRLLADSELTVRRAALEAVGRAPSPFLWPAVIAAAGRADTRHSALAALTQGGAQAAEAIVAALASAEPNRASYFRLLRTLGRLGGPVASAALAALIDHREVEVRAAAIAALAQTDYQAQGSAATPVKAMVEAEARQTTWALAAAADLGDEQPFAILRAALLAEGRRSRNRALTLLGFLAPGPALARARENLEHASAERRAYAVELIELALPSDLRALVLPLMEDLDEQERLVRLAVQLPVQRLDRAGRVLELTQVGPEACSAWVRACALYVAAVGPVENTAPSLLAACFAAELLVRESAVWAVLYREGLLAPPQSVHHGDRPMLSTVERVLALKATPLFADTPEPVLAELAVLLRQVEFPANALIFEKGEPGASLYIIVSGSVRVFDGPRTLIELGLGEVVGEMAALDTQPRSASVIALEDTLLLRLDQGPLYELMADRFEIARGIIHTLSRRLRNLLEVA